MFTFAFAIAADWDQRFTEVCKYDRYCLRLKTSDGSWLRPKPEVVAILKDKDIQDQIKKTAAQYGVDSTALAGAILAENSLNVGLKDSVQTWLAKKAGITGIGTYEFTFGFGQISETAAWEAEDHIAKIEGRAPKSRSDLVTEITDPMGSIRIAATILRKVQDDYKAQGFDIAKNPALLSTLYNLGQSKNRAKEAKDAGTTPRANYFGLFVERYSGDIKSILGTNSPAAPVAIVANVGRPVDQAGARVAAPPSAPKEARTVAAAPVKATVRETKKVQTQIAETLSEAIPLVSQPMQCRASDYGQDPSKEAKSINYGAPVGVMQSGATYTEISRALDCKSNVWKLIKDRNGVSGWVQEDRLVKATTKKLVPMLSCKPSEEQRKCLASIRSKAGDLVLEDDLENGLVYLKPITAPNSESASFQEEDRYCGFEPDIQDRPKRNGKSNRANNYFVPAITATNYPLEELKKNAKADLDFLRGFQKRMASELGISLDELDDPVNPYQRMMRVLDNMERDIKECYQSARSENISCRSSEILGIEVKAELSKLKFSKTPSISEVTKAFEDVERTYYNRNQNFVQFNYYYNHSDEITAASTPEVIRESIINCEARMTAIQEAEAKKRAANPQPAATPLPPAGGAWGGGGMGGGYGFIGGGFGMTGMAVRISDNELFRLIKVAKPEEIQAQSANLISIARYCHGRLNLLGKTKSKNPLDCTETPELTNYGFQNFAKNLVAKIVEGEPDGLINEVFFGLQSMISLELIEALEKGAPTPTPVPSATPETYVHKYPERGNYCPNRTAETIEALLQENPCVSHAYMPTDFLTKRLGASDPRVLFRKFEKEDRYALEIGGPKCAPIEK